MLPKPLSLFTFCFSLPPTEMSKPQLSMKLQSTPFPNSLTITSIPKYLLRSSVSKSLLYCSRTDHNCFSRGLSQEPPKDLSVFSLGSSNHSANYVGRGFYVYHLTCYTTDKYLRDWAQITPPIYYISLTFILQAHGISSSNLTESFSLPLHKTVFSRSLL